MISTIHQRTRQLPVLLFVLCLVPFHACAQVQEDQPEDQSDERPDRERAFRERVRSTTVSIDAADASVLRTLNQISEQSGIPIHVDPAIRSNLRKKSTTVHVTDVPVETLLSVILKPKGYHFSSGNNRVTVRGDIDARFRIYDLRDLRIEPRARKLDLEQGFSRSATSPAKVSSGQAETSRGQQISALTSENFYDVLKQFEGQVSRYEYSDGRLKLEATPSFHRSFGRFLKQARRLLRSSVTFEGGLYRVSRQALTEDVYAPGPVDEQRGREIFELLRENGTRLRGISFRMYDRQIQNLEIHRSTRTSEDVDVELSEQAIAYQSIVRSSMVRSAVEFRPLISRDGSTLRLSVRTLRNRFLDREQSTALARYRSRKRDTGAIRSVRDGELSLPVTRTYRQGGAWNSTMNDGSWLVFNAGPGAGRQGDTAETVLILRVRIDAEEKAFPEPRPTPDWKTALRRKLTAETMDEPPTGTIRPHSLLRELAEQTSVNIHLTENVSALSRNGELVLTPQLDEEPSAAEVIEQVLAAPNIQRDLLPNLVVFRSPEEPDFRFRQLLFYDLSTFTTPIRSVQLPDSLKSVAGSMWSERKKAKEAQKQAKQKTKKGGGGKGSFLGGAFQETEHRFGASIRPKDLAKLIHKRFAPDSWNRKAKLQLVGNQGILVYQRPAVHRKIRQFILENETFPSFTNVCQLRTYRLPVDDFETVTEDVPLDRHLTDEQLNTFHERLENQNRSPDGYWTMTTVGPEQVFNARAGLISGVSNLNPVVSRYLHAYDPVRSRWRPGTGFTVRMAVVEPSNRMKVLLNTRDAYVDGGPEVIQQTGGEVLSVPVVKRSRTFVWSLSEPGTVLGVLGARDDGPVLLLELEVGQATVED